MCCAVAVCTAATVVPDGFIGIPWGSNREQIVKAMNDRGYTAEETIPAQGTPPATLLYRGAISGQSCQLEFYLLNNTFHRGRATYLGVFDVEPMKEAIYKQDGKPD